MRSSKSARGARGSTESRKPSRRKRSTAAPHGSPDGAAERRALLVLGMHRSGTSAVARVCNLLGVELGGRLRGPQPDNETGFWEHKEITRLHEELLASIGSAYDDVRALPEDWLLDTEVATYRGKIIEILRV